MPRDSDLKSQLECELVTTPERSQSAYSIRPAQLCDAPDIAHVHIESWQSTYTGIFPKAVLSGLSLEKRTEAWRGLLATPRPDAVTLVACSSTGTIVGFLDGGKELTGQLQCDSELYGIYLLPGAQRQGVGTLLVGAFVREMRRRGYASMVVWVLDLNPSKKFYEALGGSVITQKSIERGGLRYLEIAFGWRELHALPRSDQ